MSDKKKNSWLHWLRVIPLMIITPVALFITINAILLYFLGIFIY
jgi:hypothetical protein